MSQIDYIYLDMQTTNVQSNSTTVTQGNLIFNSTLNTPIVPNDYYLSVDKFQVDTSELPVLLVEPDLASTPFVPNKTIHKVGIMTSGANLLLSGNYDPLNVVDNHFILPINLKNVPSITNVMWEQQDISPPNLNELTGINTIQFPYYHCKSYSKFIKVVNDAIASSYVNNYNYLFNNWISTLGNNTKYQFIDLVARSFPIPPFLEWDTTKSIAKMYVNQFFYGSNYLLPSSLWNSHSHSSTRTVIKFPLDLKIVFNASLYSLFNTFPATPTIINGEQFYILEIANILNNIELSLTSSFPTIERYSFLQTYVTNGVLTIPYLDSFEYPISNYYVITEQEAPTIDTWNPIYSFALVIPHDISIQDQLKTLSLHGSSSTPKNVKADFIIKIDGNYRPTFIYSEKSNVNLIGTTPITTLEMNVYYISKTGILVPFKLSRSGSASLRILFEKKRKTRISIN